MILNLIVFLIIYGCALGFLTHLVSIDLKERLVENSLWHAFRSVLWIPTGKPFKNIYKLKDGDAIEIFGAIFYNVFGKLLPTGFVLALLNFGVEEPSLAGVVSVIIAALMMSGLETYFLEKKFDILGNDLSQIKTDNEVVTCNTCNEPLYEVKSQSQFEKDMSCHTCDREQKELREYLSSISIQCTIKEKDLIKEHTFGDRETKEWHNKKHWMQYMLRDISNIIYDNYYGSKKILMPKTFFRFIKTRDSTLVLRVTKVSYKEEKQHTYHVFRYSPIDKADAKEYLEMQLQDTMKHPRLTKTNVQIELHAALGNLPYSISKELLDIKDTMNNDDLTIELLQHELEIWNKKLKIIKDNYSDKQIKKLLRKRKKLIQDPKFLEMSEDEEIEHLDLKEPIKLNHKKLII